MTIQIPVLSIKQNNWQIYVGSINAMDLFETSKSDKLRLENIRIPKYAGYQRPLVKERVEEIKDYLNTQISTFPNSIIVSLDSEYIKNWTEIQENKNVGFIEIEKEPGVFTIIDGQHRAAALDAASENFKVILSIFIDLEIIKAAEIFAKINSTQKAVNPSIAFELFGYSDRRSPQRTAHDIAKVLNETIGSPFYKKLRMLGTKDDWAKGNLSQSTFAKALFKLFTKNHVEDENALIRGEKLVDYPNYPLRKYFIAEEDNEILSIVWKFFFHVANTWPEQWSDSNVLSILKKTTGYISFIEILKIWLIKDPTQVLNDEILIKTLDSIKDKYSSDEFCFIKDTYPAGSQGVIKLRDQLLVDLNLEN
jgi:DGQHR domain-containing protein